MEHLIPATVSQQGNRMMKRIEVVAAIIHDAEGRIFATQRGYGEFKDGWEFPDGKMEATSRAAGLTAWSLRSLTAAS
jgi:hypothetical protein